MKLKVDTQNIWLAGSALLVAVGFVFLVVRWGRLGKEAPSSDGKKSDEPGDGGWVGVSILALIVVFFSMLAGYWLRGEVETVLTERQIRDLRGSSEFTRAFDMARDSTTRAEQLQARVADLEKQIAVSQASARSNSSERALFGSQGLLVAVVVAAAISSLLMWIYTSSRSGRLRAVLEGVAASVSAAIDSLEGASVQTGSDGARIEIMQYAINSALNILNNGRRGLLLQRFE